ncbi:MAG: hypothetical protein M3O31_09490 [Acidobacteriota bacterium]|nr:hypothetical protein [Acidobacteriota bacterium]
MPKSGKRSNSTLKSRIGSNHIKGRVARSTLRRTLTACLNDVLRLEAVGPKELTKDSEGRLTDWICQHLSIAIHPSDDRDGLLELEAAVLQEIDPPLNLGGCATSALRARLSEVRNQKK